MLPLGKCPLGRSRWVVSIKMKLREIRWEVRKWIEVVYFIVTLTIELGIPEAVLRQVGE